MSKPRVTIHPNDPRPFWVETGNPETFRSYKRFHAAVRYALRMAAKMARRREPIMPSVQCVAGELRRYKVTARVADLLRDWSAVLTISARSRSAAVILAVEQWAERGLSANDLRTRMLPRAKSDGKAAKQKRNKADRSGKRRRQINARETRVLLNAGMSDAMAEMALDAAKGAVRVARR